jgi:hypothetical protein
MDDGFREQDPSHGKGDPSMGETLTIEEIEARYAPFWVLIGEPETDD